MQGGQYCTSTGIETLMFRTGLNTGRIDYLLAIPANFGQYWLVQGIFFFFFFFKFCNF